MRTITLALLTTLAACDVGGTVITPDAARRALIATIETGIVAPDQVMACGDILASARDADDTHAVFLTIDDSITWDAAQAGTTLTRTYELPHPAVSVVAQWGADLTIWHCGDIIEPGTEPIVDGEAQAIGGTVTVTVEPSGRTEPWDFGGMATIELEDIELEHAPTGVSEIVPPTAFEPVYVGWLPG